MNDELRALFPVTKHSIYLNHAAVSPPPQSTIDAVELQLRDVSHHGSVNFRDWLAAKERARKLAAKMIGARPEQFAFTRNTSDGLSTVANGFHWKAGDNIVTFRREFPSNVYPWLRLQQTLGVEVRFCEERAGRIDLAELIGLIDAQTRIIAISQVQFASGFRADLERLGQAARRHDALLVVDVIQSMGVIPIDVDAELIDVAAGACHKWLLTPEGIGFLYLSDRARERIDPTLVGWISVPDPEDYFNHDQGWNEGALAWETGTGPAALLFGLETSLKLLESLGIEKIEKYLAELTDYLCDRLPAGFEMVSSRSASEKSQIVAIRHERETPMSLYARLKAARIVTAPRGDSLRIAPHCYNTQAEIDELLRVLG